MTLRETRVIMKKVCVSIVIVLTVLILGCGYTRSEKKTPKQIKRVTVQMAKKAIRREKDSKKRMRGERAYVTKEANAYTGIFFKHHKNGKLQSEVSYKYGKLNGVMKGWFENGKPMLERYYKYGTKHGVSKIWYKNGQPQSEMNHENGVLKGVMKGWHDNGQLKSTCSFKHGKKHGVARFWSRNGELEAEETYKDGKFIENP